MKGSIKNQVDMDLRCCRYCRYYEYGYCVNPNNTMNSNMYDENSFLGLSEEGYINENIIETLESKDVFEDFYEEIRNVALNHSMKSSNKHLSEFKDEIRKVYNEFIKEVSLDIDNNLCVLLDDRDSYKKFEIKDPDKMCCSYYM